MQSIKEFFTRHKSIILYVFFGGLTTAVNYIVYFGLSYFARFTALTSHIFAWVAAVLFAFFTNKPFVFQSNTWTLQVILKELAAFVRCRLLTGAMEAVFLYILVDVHQMNALIWKLVISIAVVILNYIGSRFIFVRK